MKIFVINLTVKPFYYDILDKTTSKNRFKTLFR